MNRTLIVIGNDPETSKKVQEKLFNSGFSWSKTHNDQTVQHTQYPILSVNSIGTLYFLSDYWYPLEMEDGKISVDAVYTAEYFLNRVDADKISGAKPAKVKELSMDELNSLTLAKFGYKVKIVEKA